MIGGHRLYGTGPPFGPTRSFVVEVGTMSGTSDVAVIDTGSAATSYRWSPAPLGRFYIRVKARNEAGDGPPSQDVVVRSLDPRDFIEAIFLGSGPLRGEPPYCSGVMTGWPAGSEIRVLVSTSVPAVHRDVAMKTVAQFLEATHGSVRGTVAIVDDPNPLPRKGEITIAALDGPAMQAFCGRAAGCALTTLRGHEIRSARIAFLAFLSSAERNVVAHELGHAVLGLCHMSVNGTSDLQPPAIMGNTSVKPNKQDDSWDPSTVKASAAVYGAGLTPGAGWAEFFAAGLVNVPSSSSSFAAPSAGTPALPEGWIIRQQGDETIVIKPLCHKESPERR